MSRKPFPLKHAAMAAGAFLLAASTTHATTLLPNTSGTPTVLTTPAGTIVSGGGTVTPITFPTSVNPLFSGTLWSAVFDPGPPGGGLDFYYQVSNDSTSLTSMRRLVNFMFNGYTTDVFYRTDTVSGFATPVSVSALPPPAPLSADRDATGRLVGFNYSLTGSSDEEITKINPGETSFIVVIRTNAPSFTAGNTLVHDGTVNLATFAPLGIPTPEPTTLILLSSAFAVAGGLARRHRARRQRLQRLASSSGV